MTSETYERDYVPSHSRELTRTDLRIALMLIVVSMGILQLFGS
ncbi:MAG: hypothetical protein WBO55_05950 [Rhizobiaceae bacterium]